jgi:hypothetical protein
MADFLRKILPDYTAERQPKNANAVQESDTQTEIPSMVTPKRDISSDVEDPETIDLREMTKTPRFLDSQYGIRKDGDTFMIGNSTIDLDEPGIITVRGKRFKLTKGLWELLTRKDIDTDTIFPNDMRRYKSILEMTNAHLQVYEPGGDINISRGFKYTK